MPRPTTKPDLIAAANAQFARLWALIDAMPEAEQNAEFAFGADFLQRQKEAHWQRDRNLRDVLIHLYEWHRLLLDWIHENRQGHARPFLPAPYNWKTYAQMNVEFWRQHQRTSYAQARAMLQASHAEVICVIANFSDDALFAKQHFAWTGTTTLGSYCTSATASHYHWAIKKIQTHINMCAARQCRH